MRIAILSPPLGSLTQAPLSLPSLTAFLRESGHEVAQHDLGIKCIDRMLTRDYLEEVVRAHQCPGLAPACSRRIVS